MSIAAAQVLASVLLVGTPATTATDALVDAVVEAYGGAAAVRKLESFRVEGDIQSALNGPGKLRRDFQAPDKLRVEIAYAATTEVRLIDGATAWRGDAGKLTQVTGAPMLAMIYQLLRSSVPGSLVRHRGKLQDRGKQTRDSIDYQLLGLLWSSELDVTFWVNAKTRRVEWIESAITTGPLKTGFVTHYDDFKTVDGLLVPMAETTWASGRATGLAALRSVVFAPKDLGPFDRVAL